MAEIRVHTPNYVKVRNYLESLGHKVKVVERSFENTFAHGRYYIFYLVSLEDTSFLGLHFKYASSRKIGTVYTDQIVAVSIEDAQLFKDALPDSNICINVTLE